MISEINLDEALEKLKLNGIYEVENFITTDLCESYKKKLFKYPKHVFDTIPFKNASQWRINGVVYNAHPFLSVPELAEVILKEELIKIGEKFFNKKLFFSNTFAYQIESYKSKIFPWHIDNYDVFDHKKNDSCGLVFLLHLDTVKEGGTEFLLGSDIFSNNSEKIKFDFVNDELDAFESFYSLPIQGKLVIARSDLIHRGATSMPDITKSYKRATIRWQSTSNPSKTTETYIPISSLPKNSIILEYLNKPNQIKLDSGLNPNFYKYDNEFLIRSLIFTLYLLFLNLSKKMFKYSKNILRRIIFIFRNILIFFKRY